MIIVVRSTWRAKGSPLLHLDSKGLTWRAFPLNASGSLFLHVKGERLFGDLSEKPRAPFGGLEGTDIAKPEQFVKELCFHPTAQCYA